MQYTVVVNPQVVDALSEGYHKRRTRITSREIFALTNSNGQIFSLPFPLSSSKRAFYDLCICILLIVN
jgi:hypothetical protein